MSIQDDKEVRAYKDFMQQELSRREIQDDKKKFVRSYFEEPSQPLFPLGMALPLLALALLFAFFLQIKPVPYGPYLAAPAAVPAALQEEPEEHFDDSVHVKRVSSSWGPVMIYQKEHEGTPVTIVWVFAGGKTL